MVLQAFESNRSFVLPATGRLILLLLTPIQGVRTERGLDMLFARSPARFLQILKHIEGNSSLKLAECLPYWYTRNDSACAALPELFAQILRV